MKLVASRNLVFLLASSPCALAWTPGTIRHPFQSASKSSTKSSLDMAAVGIFFGTSTGSTQTAAEKISKAFGDEIAAEPIDVETLEEGQLGEVFSQHTALVVGTPTWNTGADTERSGTGWDELYYKKLPKLKSILEGKKVAVFGLGDQISYAENYADATGELYDVFESMGCVMLGSWSQEGYEHEASKSIRGDMFCGLLLDMVNQEELTDERVEQWVTQLKEEGILDAGSTSSTVVDTRAKSVFLQPDALSPTPNINGVTSSPADLGSKLDTSSNLLDQNIGAHSSDGFTPYYNPASGRTMWVSQDGRKSYVTADERVQTKHLSP